VLTGAPGCLLQMFMINITFRIGRPLQAANVIVQVLPIRNLSMSSQN